MGLKSLVLIVAIAVFIIFAIQNGGAIALAFFGFNSPALPLWIWILVALLAGIISSLFINLLSSHPVGNNSKNQSFNPPYPPPPQPSRKKEKYQPLEESNPIPETPTAKLNYRWEEDEVFEDLPDNPVNAVEEIATTNPENEAGISAEDIVEDIKEEKRELEEIIEEEIELKEENLEDNQEIEQEEEKEEQLPISSEEKQPSVTENDSSPILKQREASPYSYQTREKTQIRPKTVKKAQEQAKIPPSPPKRLYKGVYDAPYRVIAPSQNDVNNDDNDFYDDEEDWDF